MKQHWKLTLSYDGTDFHGWQIQPGLRTVQGTLSAAIKRVSGEEVLPQGSGRTDTGVHALAQIASFALDAPVPPQGLLRALNRALPASIRVTTATHALESFHARHGAIAKTYEYRIFHRCRAPGKGERDDQGICSPFLAPFVWDCHWSLSLPRMQAAAGTVCGSHDFTSFAASDPDTNTRSATCRESKVNPVKTIWESVWTQEENLLIYHVRGSGFLHHMVRNLVGTFVDIGRGSLKPDDIALILAARNRSAAGPTAPPQGLFLQSVEYELQPEGSREAL